MTQASESPSADPFTSSLAGRRLGRYEVLARLASGGMAGVYVARALGVAGFERLFAIKVLHPHLAHEDEFITMFLDEARLAARIRHPNVVATIDISDTQDAGYYLVMDYVEGDHLGALLQRASERRTRLPAPVALRIVLDALDGLGAAHALVDENNRPLNLVHRDVSPHNIMVGTDGVARLTDFGVAKAEFRIGATRDGQFKGKLAYMAPEHAADGVADQRSDLFAMGIILWESLTGRRLFRSENQAATLNKICLEPIPLPSFVDPELAPFDPVLQRALARDPRKRYQNAEEFAEAIERSAGSLGGLANQRAVAKIVRTYAAVKLSHDDHLIRSAVTELTRTHTPTSAGMSGAHRRMPPPGSQSYPPGPPADLSGSTGSGSGSSSYSLGPLSGPQAPAGATPSAGTLAPQSPILPDEDVFARRPQRALWISAAALLGAALLVLGYRILSDEDVATTAPTTSIGAVQAEQPITERAAASVAPPPRVVTPNADLLGAEDANRAAAADEKHAQQQPSAEGAAAAADSRAARRADGRSWNVVDVDAARQPRQPRQRAKGSDADGATDISGATHGSQPASRATTTRSAPANTARAVAPQATAVPKATDPAAVSAPAQPRIKRRREADDLLLNPYR